MTPKVSVIVPTYRDWDRLGVCLSALAAQSYPAELLEIVVADNDPSAGLPPTVRLPSNARVIAAPRKGSFAARNAALAEARGDILLFTDADCVPDPDWCAAAVGYLQRHPDLARVGGAIRLMPSGPTPGVADVYETAFAFPQEKYVAIGWSPTANMGAWRRVFESVGPFDDAHYSGGDHEWGMRADAAGHRIGYCADAAVAHPARTLGEILIKRRRMSGAKLGRRIAHKGRVRLVPAYVLKLLGRAIPPVSPIGRLAGLHELPARHRLMAYLFHYYMKLDAEIECGRILLFRKTPERR